MPNSILPPPDRFVVGLTAQSVRVASNCNRWPGLSPSVLELDRCREAERHGTARGRAVVPSRDRAPEPRRPPGLAPLLAGAGSLLLRGLGSVLGAGSRSGGSAGSLARSGRDWPVFGR